MSAAVLYCMQVWSQQETGDAWLNKLGSPTEAAAWILQDPQLRLGAPLYKHLPQQVSGEAAVHQQQQHQSMTAAAGVRFACRNWVDRLAGEVKLTAVVLLRATFQLLLYKLAPACHLASC